MSATNWRRVVVEVVCNSTNCQSCFRLVQPGESIAMVQLHQMTRQVELWCMACLLEEIARCSELMFRS